MPQLAKATAAAKRNLPHMAVGSLASATATAATHFTALTPLACRCAASVSTSLVVWA